MTLWLAESQQAAPQPNQGSQGAEPGERSPKPRVGGETWVWNRSLHGDAVDIETVEVTGETKGTVGFTFTDGFAGIGGGRLGMEQASGVCTGGV